MEEYYHKDIFGNTVDIDLLAEDELGDVGGRARPDFNIFLFTDAVGVRDKKRAWMLYQKALASGYSPEEVFWKVVWQVKTMLIAKKTKNANEADMKDYPYRKAKGNLKNFKEGELESLSEELVIGYHNIRRGIEDAETFVEKFVLGL